MKHCERCNIVHVNLECPLCAANMKIEKLRVVVKAAPLMLGALKKIEIEAVILNARLGYGETIERLAHAAIGAAEGKEKR